MTVWPGIGAIKTDAQWLLEAAIASVMTPFFQGRKVGAIGWKDDEQANLVSYLTEVLAGDVAHQVEWELSTRRQLDFLKKSDHPTDLDEADVIVVNDQGLINYSRLVCLEIIERRRQAKALSSVEWSHVARKEEPLILDEEGFVALFLWDLCRDDRVLSQVRSVRPFADGDQLRSWLAAAGHFADKESQEQQTQT